MGRPTKEYQAFTSLVDQVLTVAEERLHGGLGAERSG